MRRKTIIIYLLLVMALLPAAQAAGLNMPAASERQAHGLMAMDCGQLDPGHCIDFENCASGGHSSCDAQTKSTQLPPQPMDRPRSRVYVSHAANSYLSHHAELLLRPPRNA